MRSQHHRGNADLVPELFGKAAKIDVALVPILPRVCIELPHSFEGVEQGGDRKGRRGFMAAGKTKREHRMARREFPDQCDIARSGLRIGPCHASMGGEVLPSVAVADITRAGAPPGATLRQRVDSGKGERKGCLRGAKRLPIAIAENFRKIRAAAADEMRSEKSV